MCIPSPKPQPTWRSPGDFKACSFLEGQGLKLLLFSLHSPECLQCEVQRRGNINRDVNSVSLLMKGRAELPWNGQGPLVPAPLCSVCSPVVGIRQKTPPGTVLALQKPQRRRQKDRNRSPGIGLPSSQEMQLDFQLTFRLLQAKEGELQNC